MIGERALGARDRRIVNDRDLIAATGVDLAIDRVEAGVANAAHEPAAIDAGFRIEHRLGLFKPIDILRRLSPKALRVALPARVDLVIAARTGVHDASSTQLYRHLRTESSG